MRLLLLGSLCREGEEGAPEGKVHEDDVEEVPAPKAESVEGDQEPGAKAESGKGGAMPMHSTLGQWLRTCASATDLEVASMLSMAPSQASTTDVHPAAPGVHPGGHHGHVHTHVPPHPPVPQLQSAMLQQQGLPHCCS